MNENEYRPSPQATSCNNLPHPPVHSTVSVNDQAKTKHILSILSMIFGIASLLTFPIAITVTGSFFLIHFFFSCAMAFSILGFIFSHLSRMNRHRNGMAICGLVCSIITFSLCVFMILLTALLIYGMMMSAPVM